MDAKQKKGRPAKPKRTVVNIVTRIGGKRHHFHSFTIAVEPVEVMRVLQECFAGKFIH